MTYRLSSMKHTITRGYCMSFTILLFSDIDYIVVNETVYNFIMDGFTVYQCYIVAELLYKCTNANGQHNRTITNRLKRLLTNYMSDRDKERSKWGKPHFNLVGDGCSL